MKKSCNVGTSIMIIDVLLKSGRFAHVQIAVLNNDMVSISRLHIQFINSLRIPLLLNA